MRWAVLGAGNIGSIVLDRLRAAGVSANRITVCEVDPSRGVQAHARFGVTAVPIEAESSTEADVLLLAIPPGEVVPLLRDMAGRLRPGQIVISLAAAVPLAVLESLVPERVAVARVMPSAPSMVGEGMNPVAYGHSVGQEARQIIEAFLMLLGQTIAVADEMMNWCVGLSGAALRSLLPALEGLTQAGVEAGLSPQEARRIAGHGMRGAADLALRTALTFEEIKKLTPMQMLDETALAEMVLEAARRAREKTDRLQARLEAE